MDLGMRLRGFSHGTGHWGLGHRGGAEGCVAMLQGHGKDVNYPSASSYHLFVGKGKPCMVTS